MAFTHLLLVISFFNIVLTAIDNCQNCKTCDSQTNTCSECSAGYYRNNGGCRLCEHVCLDNSTSSLPKCREVDGYCEFGCKTGFYGDKCSSPCSVTCKSGLCERITGRCLLGCTDTRFTGINCLDYCEPGCFNGRCTQDGDCLYQCKPDYYNDPQCDRQCASCSSDSGPSSGRNCDITDGRCLHGCAGGVVWGSYCNNSCPTGCHGGLCDFYTGHCTDGCKNSSFWGVNCSYQCNENCVNNKCAKEDGHCLEGCESNRTWGLNCSKKCRIGCFDGRCTQDGDCLNQCKPDYYNDPKCDRQCASCSSDSGPSPGRNCNITDGRCLHGCAGGNMWGSFCNTSCPTGCDGVLCNFNTGHCTGGCQNTSLWGDDCSYVCSENCVNDACAKEDGLCLEGCLSNTTWGLGCSKDCPNVCSRSECDSRSAECTTGCTDNSAWGSNCSYSCPDVCLNGKCSQYEGSCTEGCIDNAMWGKECDMPCSPYCTNGNCDHINGHCSSGCVNESKWGNNCASECSPNCLNERCNQTNGHCIDGCESNMFWTPSCNESCSHCEKGCEQDTGTCSGESNVAQAASWWYYIIIAVAVVMAAALVAVIIVSKKRKRKHKKIEEDVEFRTGGVNRPMRVVNALTTLFVQNPITKMVKNRLTHSFQPARTDSLKTNKIKVENILHRVLNMERSELETEFENFGAGFIKPYTAATRDENTSKNTYTNIYPYDDNRVVLSSENNKDDYINASFIDGFLTKKRYIAAQGPSRQTKDDFWKMVWQENVTCIVMMYGTLDNECQMADKYLPEIGGAETFGDISVYSQSCENYADFDIKQYKLTKAGAEKRVVHMQFKDWQDGTPPSSPSSVIEFHQKYRSIVPKDMNPTVVHCTAGVGRTGVFIALDFLTDEGLISGAVDVYSCVAELRKQRVFMVQTQEQYEFLYQAIAQSLGLHCQLIPLTDFADLALDLEDQFQKCNESLEFDRDEIPTLTFEQEVKRKDRPTSDIPDPRYRPKLASNKYINAVIQDTYRYKEGVIVTQMPTPSTVADFCKLVKEKNCSTILMLNPNDRKMKSYGVYWPKKGSTTKYGDVQVTTLSIDEFHTHTDRILKFEAKVKKVKESQEVKMIQYKEWDDVNMVPDPSQMIALVKTVREYMNRNPGRPLLVHCLNGSEQSGLYCVVHDLLEKMLTENEISVINSVRKLKVRIPKALPTFDQFKLCYNTVSSYIAQKTENDQNNA